MQQLIPWFLNDVMQEEVAQQADHRTESIWIWTGSHSDGHSLNSTSRVAVLTHSPETVITRLPFEIKSFRTIFPYRENTREWIIESYLQSLSTRNVEKVIYTWVSTRSQRQTNLSGKFDSNKKFFEKILEVLGCMCNRFGFGKLQ